MARIKGIFNEHKQLIMVRLKEKRKPLLGLLLKKGLIQHAENSKVQNENDHDALRSIFDVIENRNNEQKFVEILRDINDETANLVEKPPETNFVRQLPRKSLVELESRVALECELGKKYSVQWLKNKQELKQNKNISINSLNGVHTLTISKLKRTDIGEYSCICGCAETVCELKIEERLQFIKPLEDRFVLKGETVDLHCKLNVPCNEEPKWSRDGQNLPEDDIHFKKENTPFTKKLTISNFQRTYAGVYQCACDTALTSATIKISAESKTQHQVRLSNPELEQRFRKCQGDLEDEKLTVSLLLLEKQDLQNELQELKIECDLNKTSIRHAEKKIKVLTREMDTKKLRIASLENRLVTFSRDLQKKEKTIQNLSNNVEKLVEVHKETSSEKQKLDTQVNDMIQGFKQYSSLQTKHETERKQHEKSLKELKGEMQKAQMQKQKADSLAINAEIEKKMAEHEKKMAEQEKKNAEQVIKQSEEEKRVIQRQKDALEQQQKLAQTDIRRNVLHCQDLEREKLNLEYLLKQSKDEMTKANDGKQAAEINAEKAIQHTQMVALEKENKTKETIRRLERANRELSKQISVQNRSTKDFEPAQQENQRNEKNPVVLEDNMLQKTPDSSNICMVS